MSARVFIDSNVFLYAVEQADEEKAVRAGDWLRYLLGTGRGIANLQVLNEVANVLFKRGRLPAETVFALVDDFSAFGNRPLDDETVMAARLIRFETEYSWWDCILLASAISLGCREFLTEDLQHGHVVRGLTIVSPFRHSPPHSQFH